MRRRPQTQHHRALGPKEISYGREARARGKEPPPTNRSGWGPALARGWVGTAQLVGDPAMGRGPVVTGLELSVWGGNKGTGPALNMRTPPPFSWHPPREPTHEDALKPL